MSLPLSSQALALLPSLPEDTPCVAEPAVAELAEQVLHRPPVLQQAPQRWLQAAQSDWDLAQFEFSSSGRARAFKKLGTAWADVLAAPQWRAARWGALLLVAVNLVGLNAWAWRERSALEEKREAIRRTLTQTFPQVKVVVDAPVQMEKEVRLAAPGHWHDFRTRPRSDAGRAQHRFAAGARCQRRGVFARRIAGQGPGLHPR